MTGEQEIAILCDFSGHLPWFLGQMGCLGRQVSSFFAPVADLLDTCRAGAGARGCRVMGALGATVFGRDFGLFLLDFDINCRVFTRKGAGRRGVCGGKSEEKRA